MKSFAELDAELDVLYAKRGETELNSPECLAIEAQIDEVQRQMIAEMNKNDPPFNEQLCREIDAFLSEIYPEKT